MSEWQPIETAPRDQYVLVFRAGLNPNAVTRVLIGARKSASKWWPPNMVGMGKPTHWMPLPAAPSGDSAGKDDGLTAQMID